MLSTRLSWPEFSSNGKTQATNHCLICYSLILASQPTRTSPDISAPLDPISLWALAWSDVSVQHLVPKLGESTILRLRSESYSIVASYNGEPDLRAVFMLGVLTYLFYLLSKPNIPSSECACRIDCRSAALGDRDSSSQIERDFRFVVCGL